MDEISSWSMNTKWQVSRARRLLWRGIKTYQWGVLVRINIIIIRFVQWRILEGTIDYDAIGRLWDYV